jgi:homoserine kinase
LSNGLVLMQRRSALMPKRPEMPRRAAVAKTPAENCVISGAGPSAKPSRSIKLFRSNKKRKAMLMIRSGAKLHDVAKKFGVDHDTILEWTGGAKAKSPRPPRKRSTRSRNRRGF